jgi:hypothetical protein
MTRRALLTAAHIILVAFLGLAVTSGGSARQRDLTGYEKAVADFIHSAAPAVVLRDLQDFVWTHWKQRRRGYVLIRSVTAEGQEMVNMTKQLFIESLKDGSWCVHGEIQAAVAPLRWMPASQRKPPKSVVRHFEAVSVEKVGGDQHLVLKDKNGNVVDTIANATAYFE